MLAIDTIALRGDALVADPANAGSEAADRQSRRAETQYPDGESNSVLQIENLMS